MRRSRPAPARAVGEEGWGKARQVSTCLVREIVEEGEKEEEEEEVKREAEERLWHLQDL